MNNTISEKENYSNKAENIESRYKFFFDNFATATCILDENNLITLCNPKFEDLSSYRKTDIEGKLRLTDLIRENDLSSQNKLQKIQEAETLILPEESIFTIVDGNNNKKNVLLNFALLPDSKEKICSIVDLTEFKKIEKKLIKAKEKVEKSNRLKTIFLANMSHEIRTPMNAIIGFSQLLKIKDHPGPKRKEYADIIVNKGNILLKLIDDFIEISKYETGELNINKTNCDINELLIELKEFYNQVKIQKGKENLEIILSKPANPRFILNTDPGRLQQVLSNLISNAVKFTEKGFVKFGYTILNNSTIEFFVTDTGIGLTKKQKKNVFDWFRLADITDERDYNSGSGLGLTISKGIIKLLGGKIWVESEPKKGSTFFFTIPHEKSEQEKKSYSFVENESYPDYNWQNKVILVVEDENVNYQFIEAVLEKTRAKVLHARSGKQAIELCKSINQIDLILMDIRMPGISGFTAAKQIKKIRNTIPVIAQTAYSMEDDKEQSLKSGCDDYISKPIEIKILFNKINKLLY